MDLEPSPSASIERTEDELAPRSGGHDTGAVASPSDAGKDVRIALGAGEDVGKALGLSSATVSSKARLTSSSSVP